MEIRDFAEQIVCSERLEDKLKRFEGDVTDESPGKPIRFREPARSPELKFAPRRKAPSMPRPGAFVDPHRRAVAHHIMANHELQALEVMAFVLCAFPDAPLEFRNGMVAIMDDEQRHTRMHIDRAGELKLRFGQLPVNCYIWNKAQSFESVLDYLAGLPLTFEGRNLDHTLEFEDYFRRAGDHRSAAVMRIIHRDEIEHVAFGLKWLRRLKRPDQSDWDAYRTHLHWPLRPEKSKGDIFHRAPRLAAGLTDEFVDCLEQLQDDESEPNP